MLRALIALLLLANLAFWAWHHEPIARAIGLPLHTDRQPERLQRQVHAEQIALLEGSPEALATDAASSGAIARMDPLAASCLQTRPLTQTQLRSAQQQLQGVGIAATQWVEWRRQRPPLWSVFVARAATAQALQARRDALRAARLAPRLTALTDGTQALYVGEYEQQGEAQAQAAALVLEGHAAARAVVVREASTEQRLRFEAVTPAQREALQALPGGLAALAWEPCDASPAP